MTTRCNANVALVAAVLLACAGLAASEQPDLDDLATSIDVARDGEEALARLFDESERLPEVVLLDLKLPKIDGLVAEHGSVAGHLASLAREFGVPAVFGMSGAASRLPRAFRSCLWNHR